MQVHLQWYTISLYVIIVSGDLTEDEIKRFFIVTLLQKLSNGHTFEWMTDRRTILCKRLLLLKWSIRHFYLLIYLTKVKREKKKKKETVCMCVRHR